MSRGTSGLFSGRIVALVAAALLVAAWSPRGARAAEGEPDVGFMKVTLMPEYDSSSVLVIEEGKFADRSAFPRAVVFYLPPNVTKLTDVCSLSPSGHHFCQLFDIKKMPDKNVLNMKLPYSDFFIDFDYSPFKAAAKTGRDFTFPLEPNYNIRNLEVLIQKPYRAERFSVTPASAETVEKEGYQYLKYGFQNVRAGELKNFRISYFKQDAMPSVNSKYSAMAKTHLFQDYSAEIILAVGVVGIAAAWMVKRRKAA
ncbi:MAG: hypothetical protein HY098_00725 [Nitrospinae bacterium]|nr:hypothetical protein [Nitrospinota bacterium]